MSITKKYYLWQSSLLTMVVGGMIGGLYYRYFPHHYIAVYPFIPAFFWFTGFITIQFTEMCRRQAPARVLQVYMLIRVLRMLLAIVVMAVYCVAVREDIRIFLFTFIVNYLIYLIYDSWFFFMFERNHLRKRI